MLARLVACSACLVFLGSNLEMAPGRQKDEGLRSFGAGLLAALRKSDFDRFASLCGGQVCFNEYEYVFPHPKDKDALWFTPLFRGVGSTGRRSKGVHEYKMHCYVWSSQARSDVIARRLFRNLVREVLSTADSFSDGIQVGSGVLLTVPTAGEAIWGEMASDEYWRIEFSRQAGGWRVSAIAMGIH